MSSLTHVAIIPRDGLFCKDGRGWHTSASGRGHSLAWPWPSTIRGALCTAWGRVEEECTGTVFGDRDWPNRTADIELQRSVMLRKAHRDGFSAGDRVWPVPEDALWLESHEQVFRLLPKPGVAKTIGRPTSDDAARENLLFPTVDEHTKPLPRPRYWSEVNFAAWLSGDQVPTESKGNFEISKRLRVQAHVGIDPKTLAHQESILFTHDIVETLERGAEWAIGAQVLLPSARLPDIGTLGGDGRPVRIEKLDSALFEIPATLAKAFRKQPRGLRLVIVTPAEFANGWYPDGFQPKTTGFKGRLPGLDFDLIMHSALVGRPTHISGWDRANHRAKPTMRMVPPGSVYFFERADHEPFSEADTRKLWLTAIGSETKQGFGRVVPGIWDLPRSLP